MAKNSDSNSRNKFSQELVKYMQKQEKPYRGSGDATSPDELRRQKLHFSHYNISCENPNGNKNRVSAAC